MHNRLAPELRKNCDSLHTGSRPGRRPRAFLFFYLLVAFALAMAGLAGMRGRLSLRAQAPKAYHRRRAQLRIAQFGRGWVWKKPSRLLRTITARQIPRPLSRA